MKELDRRVVGVVYIFRSSDSGYTWTEVQKLRASSTAANYGASLAMDGSTIAVGARKDSSVNFNAGAWTLYLRLSFMIQLVTLSQGLSMCTPSIYPERGVNVKNFRMVFRETRLGGRLQWRQV